MKIILSSIVVILFLSGFWICKSSYPNAFGDNYIQLDVNKFTDLRYTIYAILIGLCFIIQERNTNNKLEKFIWSIGFGLSISDIIDRYYFNITIFTKEDIIMITICIGLSYLEVYTKYNFANLTDHFTNKINYGRKAKIK